MGTRSWAVLSVFGAVRVHLVSDTCLPIQTPNLIESCSHWLVGSDGCLWSQRNGLSHSGGGFIWKGFMPSRGRQARWAAAASFVLVLVATSVAYPSPSRATEDLAPLRGTLITVTNNTVALNGDVTTVPRLIGNPGPDGVSLAEAVFATNNDPGVYTIQFAPALAGATISFVENTLEPMTGGSVTVNGDIDGDAQPDITLQAPPGDDTFAFVIESGDNTLHALELAGWAFGIGLSPTSSGATYANTTIANMVMTGVRDGITLHPPGPLELRESHNRWPNTRLIGNTLNVEENGIRLMLHFTVGDSIDGLAITDNEIRVSQSDPHSLGLGIQLAAGFWPGSTGNRFSDVLIADNTILGNPAAGILIYSGSIGAHANLIENLAIHRNTIRIGDPEVAGISGIALISGDGSTAYHDPSFLPVGYSEDNVMRDVEIVDNYVEWVGDWGIGLDSGNEGAGNNTISDVRIAGNTLRGTVHGDGVFYGIGAIAGDSTSTSQALRNANGNQITRLAIHDNTIRLAVQNTWPPLASGGIYLAGANNNGDGNRVDNVSIAGNEINSDVISIHILGGNTGSTGNQVSDVQVRCNTIAQAPVIDAGEFPDVAGIHLTGGYDIGATANSVNGVVLASNSVAGVSNAFSATADMHGAVGNTVTWTTAAADCSAVPATNSAVGLVDPTSGKWHLRDRDGSITSFYYGNPGDVPFMGDWDCDGSDTPGLFRTSDAFAYLRNSNTQGIADIRFFFGNPSDIPLAGDFNGDGCDTLSIYRPSEARFYIINKLGENEGGLGEAEYSFLFGNQGDKPVVGDWDGDGVDEIGLHRETSGFFYYRNTLTTGVADGQFYFGDPGDRFVAGDWGGINGQDTPAVFRPSSTTFYFRYTLTQGNADSQFIWPGAGTSWLPVSGDFTLD